MTTIHDIARITGYSVATVSRAFKGVDGLSGETREKILETARELNYAPKKYAKHTRKITKNANIGVIISFRSCPWCNVIMDGICDTLEKQGILPIFVNTNEIPYREITCIDKLKNSVDGMIVYSSTEYNEYCTNFLMEINKTIPIVTIVRNTNLPTIDSVSIETYRPTYNLLTELVKNGHRHIAIVNGPMVIKPSMERFNAYTQVLNDNGIPIRNEYIFYSDFNQNTAYEIASRIKTIAPRVTAVFASNSVIARGCLKGFIDCNIKIPDDIAFVCSGDEFSFSLPGSRISVIADPDYEIGCKGSVLLLDRINSNKKIRNRNPQRVILEPELVLRGSELFPVKRIEERGLLYP